MTTSENDIDPRRLWQHLLPAYAHVFGPESRVALAVGDVIERGVPALAALSEATDTAKAGYPPEITTILLAELSRAIDEMVIGRPARRALPPGSVAVRFDLEPGERIVASKWAYPDALTLLVCDHTDALAVACFAPAPGCAAVIICHIETSDGRDLRRALPYHDEEIEC